ALFSRTTRIRPSSWRREVARTVPPDRSGLLSRSVIRHFHRVWPLETPLTLFLPDSVASAVEPEDSAVRELVRDLRTRVIACRALSHPDRAVLVDVPPRRRWPARFPHERRDHSRQHAGVESFANPQCDCVLIHAASPLSSESGHRRSHAPVISRHLFLGRDPSPDPARHLFSDQPRAT